MPYPAYPLHYSMRRTHVGQRWIGVMTLAVILFAGCKPAPKVDRGDQPIPASAEVVACEPGKYGGTMVVTEYGDPRSFNPLVEASEQTDMDIQDLFLRGLAYYNPYTQKNEPALAKSWDIAPDHKTYTFHLR